MAAPMRHFALGISRSIYVCQRCMKALSRSRFPSKLIGSTVPAFSVQNIVPYQLESEKKKENDRDSSELSASTLIRNGSVWAVDAATSILTQTITAILEVEKEYVQAVYKLTDILKYKISALNREQEQELIWDIILERRSDLQELKKKKQELELLYTSVYKLMEASAETAFAAGADYASTSAGERLYSAEREIQSIKQLTLDAELELSQVEVLVIEETTKHVEKEEKRKKEEENVDNEIQNENDND